MRRLLYCLTMCVLTAASARAADDSARLLTDLDVNHDGLLTRKEVGKRNGLLFDRLVRTSDEDGDGRLTAQELSAGLMPVRAEKAQIEKQDNRMPGGDALIVMIAKMDANRDRQLTAKEIPDRYQAVFDQMIEAGDDNKDGKLDAREMARQAPQVGLVAMMASRQLGIDVAAELAKLPKGDLMAMEQMDAYGPPQGKMMADPEQAEEQFARVDANGDGKLSADEAPPQMANRFDKMLRRADRDGDSQLSLAEFKELSRQNAKFDAIKVDPQAVERTVRQLLNDFDSDGDGQLSRKEAPRRVRENFERADQDANGKLDAEELHRAAETMQRLQKQFGGPGPGGFRPPGMAAKQPGGGKQRPNAGKGASGKRPGNTKKKAFGN